MHSNRIRWVSTTRAAPALVALLAMLAWLQPLRAAEGAACRRRPRRRSPPLAEPLATHVSRSTRRPPAWSASCRPRIATTRTRSPDIARRFNVGYDEDRARQPGRRSVAARRGHAHRAADAVRAARRAARRHRHQPGGDAPLSTFPKPAKGEQRVVDHVSDRHRQGGLGDAGRRDEDRRASARIRSGRRPLRAQGARGRTATSCPRRCRPGPTIRSARSR